MSKPGTVYLVGAGPGDAGLLTLRGAELLRRADVVIYDLLANPELLRHAPATAELISRGKRQDVSQDHLNALMVDKARNGKCVVRLKGGDPYIFGRGAEEVEALVASGGLFHGLQLWVNLPAADKMIEPRYQGLEPGDVTLLASPDGGALIRVIAGDVDGHAGPGSTHTPITMQHLTIAPGAQVDLPWNQDWNGLVYGLSGAGTVGTDQRPLSSGQLAVTGPGNVLTLGGSPSPDSRTDAFDVLVLGGQRIGEPVAQHGPFVMNTRAELVQAFEDFEAGRLGVIPPGAIGIR